MLYNLEIIHYTSGDLSTMCRHFMPRTSNSITEPGIKLDSGRMSPHFWQISLVCLQRWSLGAFFSVGCFCQFVCLCGKVRPCFLLKYAWRTETVHSQETSREEIQSNQIRCFLLGHYSTRSTLKLVTQLKVSVREKIILHDHWLTQTEKGILSSALIA